MDETTKEKILDNNRKIEALLFENETLLKGSGYQPPSKNFVPEEEYEKINIPRGYIRTSGDFWRRYHLYDVVKSRDTRNNISYCLQLSDFYNFIVNRFHIWGSVGIMLYKQDFVNLMSVMEALLLEAACNIADYCKECRNISRCSHHISKQNRDNMKNAVIKLYDMKILDIKEEEKDRIIELYNLRNRVHIRLAKNNEFLDNQFNVALHNEMVGILIRVSEKIYMRAVPYYRQCIGNVPKFEKK